MSSVILIRAAHDFGLANQGELAKIHGVTDSAIGAIVRRESWRHVPELPHD